MAGNEKEAIRKAIDASRHYTDADDKISKYLRETGEEILGDSARVGLVILEFTYRSISTKALMLTYKYSF